MVSRAGLAPNTETPDKTTMKAAAAERRILSERVAIMDSMEVIVQQAGMVEHQVLDKVPVFPRMSHMRVVVAVMQRMVPREAAMETMPDSRTALLP